MFSLFRHVFNLRTAALPRHFNSCSVLSYHYSWVLSTLLPEHGVGSSQLSVPTSFRDVPPVGYQKTSAEKVKFQVRSSTSVTQILSILHSYERRMEILPRFSPDVYQESLIKLKKLVTPGSSAHSILQALYVTSLGNKDSSSRKLSNLFSKYLQVKCRDLSATEIAILCNCTYRSSLQLSEEVSNHLVNLIKSDPKFAIQNDILTCFVKSLRISLKYDDDIFELLANNIETIKHLNFVVKVHILVYFCDALYDKVDVINDLFQSCLEEVNFKIESKDHVRIKDVDNMLWAMSNFNASLDKSSCLPLLAYIKSHYSTGNLKTRRRLFGILLSLWILRVRDKNLFDYVNKKNISLARQEEDIKVSGKIGLLLTCMHVESPLLGDGILHMRNFRLEPKMSKYLRTRPQLERILKLVKDNLSSFGFDEVICWYPVPNLYIAGLKVTARENCFSIEVLDSTVRLRKSLELHGRMSLKLRLMREMSMKFCVLDSDQNDEGILSNLRSWFDASHEI